MLPHCPGLYDVDHVVPVHSVMDLDPYALGLGPVCAEFLFAVYFVVISTLLNANYTSCYVNFA